MELLQINELIYQKQKQLTDATKLIKSRGESLATKKAEYEKMIALTLFDLKNGVEVELEGKKIINPGLSIMDKIAKGICWKEKLELEKAETEYKSILVGIEALKTSINSLQTINKYLSEIND